MSPSTNTPLIANKKPTKLFSVVWLIPILALLSGVWLLINEVRQSGPTVTLTVQNADGIEANKTPIKFLSVDIGRITEIKINKENNGVELTAKLSASAKDLLKQDTVFWLVKPRINQDGVSGLNTLVSGVYIELFPGKAEQDEKKFALADVPPLAHDSAGTRLRLTGRNDRLLAVGSPVMYEDFQVGQVERSHFDPKTKIVEYQVFVSSPNDDLLGENVQFWIKSGLDIQANSQGFKIDAGPLSSVLGGSIAFAEPKHLGKGKPIKVGSSFTIYPSQAEIPDQPTSRSIYVVAFFDQAIGTLKPGASVEYKGLSIGRVVQSPYFIKNEQRDLLTSKLMPVLFRIEPTLIEGESDPLSKEEWQQRIQNAIHKGLAATLSSSSILTGSLFIDLVDDETADVIKKPANVYNGNMVIGTRISGMDNTLKQLNNVLLKINQLDLNGTVTELNGSLSELRQTLKNVNQLTGQASTQGLPNELTKTLQSLQQTLAGVSPESPAYQEIQSTLQNINQTIKQVDPVIRTLNEKPNALIFNKKNNDPTPKGKGQ